MKHTLLLSLLLTCSIIAHAQYEAAVRYRATTPTFSVFPNPASGVVTFSYNVQDGGNDMRIVVTNVVGEKVATMQPTGSAGNAYWNPGNVAAGVYIYTASNDRGVISKGKVVVVR